MSTPKPHAKGPGPLRLSAAEDCLRIFCMHVQTARHFLRRARNEKSKAVKALHLEEARHYGGWARQYHALLMEARLAQA